MKTSVAATDALLTSTLLQLLVIIAAARTLHVIARRLGQPGAVGEIIAGLMLGPCLLGHWFPQLSHALFGDHASAPIIVISQVGLVLLMFQIGMDSELELLRAPRYRQATLAVAAVSVLVPLSAGVLLGYIAAPILAPASARVPFSLFMGLGLAITAVPILGRILREYGLTRTPVGVVAISAAALNDVLGWLLLSVISTYAVAQFSLRRVALQLAGLMLLAALLWWLLRPAARRYLARHPLERGELDPNSIALVLCALFTLALTTQTLGIFAIFGGFAGGVLLHAEHGFVEAWRRQVQPLVLVFFLPVFFAYSGLRTQVQGLGTSTELTWLAIILTVAVASKILPVYWVARACGFERPAAATLGTLMNTRALMELIVLNIGLDLGLIPPPVFTLLVLMAVTTTVMAGPLLRRLLASQGHALPVGIEA